ncbi:MAG: beta/gamma crystallin family protein [Chloroflexota bacterium]|nr:beta/gamma crystallin family protein [Chloroflexota bacterium]
MRHIVNGSAEVLEHVSFDQYEVFASVEGGALAAKEDTLFAFASEDDFLDWVRRSSPRTADQITQLMNGLAQLGIAHRENGAELKQNIQAVMEARAEQDTHDVAQAGNAGPVPLRTGLILYEDVNFGGRSFDARELAPYVDINLPQWRFGDRTSSFQLKSMVCAMFEHTWFRGRSWWVWAGPKDVPWVGQWWNDRISSCVCGPSYEAILKLILRNLL